MLLLVVLLDISPPFNQFAENNTTHSNAVRAATGYQEIRGQVATGYQEIRGQVATGNFEWNPQSFAGFYYDVKGDIGTETLSAILTDEKLSGDSPYGVRYVTQAKPKEFEFEDWGAFKIIGFLAEGYFAGYIENTQEADKNIFLNQSADKNPLSQGQLHKILIEDDTEMTVTSDAPLKLQEGYELAVTSIDVDGNKVHLELSKNGSIVDKKVISPSKEGATMADRTYCYENPALGGQKGLITIAVHFKNAFRGSDMDLATVDGLWQISDEATDVKVDTQYDKMTIASLDANAGIITMENKNNAITLSKNKDITLMSGIKIKTADNDTLRYYIYKDITEPGIYKIRGAVAIADFIWTPQNFAGFYYDIDDDIGTETLSTTLADKKLSGDFPYAVKYVTTAKSKEFEYENWGAFKIMGFLADRYFAGYVENVDNASRNTLFRESVYENSLARHQLQKILIDDDTEKTVTSFTPLMLEEGYDLAIKSIDLDGNKVYLELSKDGSVVDSKVISLSKDKPTMANNTYCYQTPAVGNQKKPVTIAAHFKNAFHGADQNLATIDGLWQISDQAIEVKAGIQYDKMTITSVDEITRTIIMENKDNTITLSKNRDIAMMPGIGIRTADNESLKYSIYQEVTIKGAAPLVVESVAAPAVEAAPAIEKMPAESQTAEAAVAANMTAEKGINKAIPLDTTIYAILVVLFFFGFTVVLSLAELWAIKKIGFDVTANLSIKGEYGKSGIQFDAVGVMAFLLFQPLMIFYLVKEVIAMLAN